MSIEDLRVSAATEETAADHFRSDIAEEIALSENVGDGEIRAVEVAQATPTGDRLAPANPAPQPAATMATDNRVTPDAANIVQLAATVSIDDIRIEGTDLVLVQADGSEIIIVNGATRVPTILLGDVELPQQTFIAALEGNGINVAAGPDGSYSASSTPGSSGGDFDDSINASQNGPIALADLLGDTSFDDPTASGAQETGKDVPEAFATAFGPGLSEAADANGVFERSTFSGQLTFISGAQQGRVTNVALSTELTSGGVAVVTEMTTGGEGENPTVILTGRAGGETVFVLEITNTLTGEFTFTLLKALDHGVAGATGAADLLGLQFTYTVIDNDGDRSSSSFSIQIADDGPSTVAVAASSAHDEALTGGNADLPAATATLSNVQLNIDWGADSANNTSANDRSLVFTNANVTVAGAFGSALTSFGVAVSTIVLADGTLVGYTGAAPSSISAENVVFHASLSDAGNGSYSFTLVKPLDHAAGGGQAPLTLTFGYTATDSDGDSAANTFVVNIVDDAPVANAGAASTAEEESLAGGNNDATDGLLSTAGGSLNIDWGSDNANFGGSNDRSVAFTNANVTVTGSFGTALTSFGVAVSTIVLADGTLVGYTGAAPSSINAENVVFHVSLSDAGNGAYAFTLVKPLDHAAGNGENTLTLTFGYTATDSDGDSAANTFVVSVVDDAPIANVGTESTVEDEAFSDGNPETEDGNNETDDNLSATSGGSLNINWGSDSANLGGSNDRSVAFTNATVTVVGAYGNGLTSLGAAVNTMVLADGTLVGYTGSLPGPASITDGRVVFYATLSDAQSGSYSFTLVKPLDHAAGDGTTGEASLSLTFNYTATDSDGDSASSQFTVRVADDTLDFFTPEEGAISEVDIPTNVDGEEPENPENGGPMPLRLLAVSSENPIANGSLGIRWGADDANGQGNAGLTEGGVNDRGVGFTDENIDGLYQQGLTSDGIALFYVTSENGTVLTAYKGSETGEVVFTVKLSDESEHGSYVFELQGNLDHTPSLGDESFGIRFDFTARDSDGDVGGSSFVVRVVDDNPVIGTPEATRLDEEDVPGLNGNAGDTYTGSKGSEGSGSVTGSLGVSWGADDNNTGSAQRSLSFNGYDAATGGEEGSTVYRPVMSGALQLTASGQAVYYFSTMVGDVPTLVGFTGEDPSNEASWVFTVTLDDTAKAGEYTFTLLQAIDHRGAGAEDDLSLSFDFRATDSDGDSDDGTFTVTINDDAPVAGDAERGAVEDEAVNGGNNETDSPVDLSAVATGKLNISWGSDAAEDRISVVFDETKKMTVEGAAGNQQLTSLGVKVETAVIGGVLVGYTGAKPTTVSDGNVVFHVSLSTDGTGGYRFELIKPLDHAPGNGTTGEAPLSLTFDYTATDADGDAINGTFTVDVADDVATIGTPYAGGIVEEEQREVSGDGNEDVGSGAGDLDADGFGGFLGLQFRDRTTHVAGGSLAISWGADNANGGANIPAGQPGDRSVQFIVDGLLDLKNQNLTSDGKEISYTVITVNGQPTLIAYTGSVAPTELPSNANAAISAHIVFSVALSDAGSGSYKFTLFDTLDHQGSVQGEDALALTFKFTATDSDGDVTGPASFDVRVIDDTPIAIGTILDRYVEEEALAGGNPDSSPAGAETAGYIANGLRPVTDKTGGPLNIAWGGDDGNVRIDGGFTGTQIAGDRSVVFATVNSVSGVVNASEFLTVKSGNTTLDVSTLTSAGKPLVFTLSENGTILTARAGAGGDVVFTVKLSDTGSGSYSFDLDGVLDHPVKASGAANEDVLSFTFKFAARDGDGDIATNDFTVKVIDDSPIAQTGTSSTVEDEAVNRGNNEPEPNLSNEVKNISLNIKWGADSADDETITSGPGNRSVAFTNKTVAVSGAAVTTGLTSHGLTVNTTLVDGVLIGHTGASPSGDNIVFRVTLSDNDNGSYSFKLLQPLDHAAGGDENALTLTFKYTATDSDGDTSSNTFTVSVIDDVPIAGNAGDRYVEEEALDGGNEDWSPIGVELAGVIANGGLITAKTGASLNMKWGSDDGNSVENGGFTGTQVAGDRSIVFEIDANRPVPLRAGVAAVSTIAVEDLAQILTVKSGDTTIALADLKSGGQSLTYALTDNGTKLTATVGGQTIFVVTLSDIGRGSYAFELKGAIDHPVKAVGASNEDVLTFNFTYTARDGDGDKATGNFAVNVIDDSPVQTRLPTTNLTLDEDDLRPYGNDTRPENLSAYGNLNVSFGADGGTFALKSDKGNWNPATSTLTAKDGSWKITVDADGGYKFTLLDNTLAHGFADNGENTISINVGFTATDGDGDYVSGDFNIRIVDDVPVATNATISKTIDEAALSDNDPATWPTAAGTLSDLVSFGADGPGKYMVERDNLSASLKSLTSNGVAITYSVVGNELFGKANGVTIFTFKVNETTGAYTFSQQGPIDHTKILSLNGEQITAASLDDRGDKVTVDAVGKSGLAYVGRTDEGDVIMRVTNDGGRQVTWTLDDNDPSTTNDFTLTIPRGTTVYINVGPVANGTVFDLDGNNSPSGNIVIGNKSIAVLNDTSLTLDLSTAITVSDGDGDKLALSGKLNITVIDTAPTMAPVDTIVFEDGVKTKTESLKIDWKSDAGSLKTLAIGGMVDVKTQSGTALDKITSNGNTVTVAMIGSILVGYIGSTKPVDASAASVVFTVKVDLASGAYTFDLRQPLDHVSPSGGEQYLALTFQAIATDADGDKAVADFTVKVDAAGVLGSIDYSSLGINNGVFVNLSAAATTVNGQEVAGDTATDMAAVTNKVVGIDGMAGVNDVKGGSGNDILIGGAEDNRLTGNGGNDILDGGLGADILDGGAGDDRFILRADVTGSGKRLIEINGVMVEVSIDGLAGTSDHVIGGLGNDVIELQRGDKAGYVADYRSAPDYISGVEKIIGTDGNDVILLALDTKADGGPITIEAGAGNDVVGGSNFGDIIYGGSGNDLISGLDGDDILEGGDGDDTIWGGDGNDTIRGGIGADTLYGEDGEDRIGGKEGNDVIYGGKGNDEIWGDAGDDRIIWNAGDGHDRVHGNNVSIGNTGTDTFVANGNDEDQAFRVETKAAYQARTAGMLFDSGSEIVVSRGDDVASELRAIDQIEVNGGSGKDKVVVAGNFDGSDLDTRAISIKTGAGDDEIDASGIVSKHGIIAEAGAGDDLLRGGAGNDILDGGDGIDTVDYSRDGQGVYVQLGAGWATTRANAQTFSNNYAGLQDRVAADTIENDKLRNIENVTGTNFADIINGDGGNNVIRAGGGDDYVIGGAGNDTLYGEGGNDTLIGGTGDDSLDGGDGNDTLAGGTGKNVIDGGAGIDTVDYSQGGFSANGKGVYVQLGSGWATSRAISDVMAYGALRDAVVANTVDNDKLKNIENVTGTDFADLINGNDGDNVIKGGDGGDWIDGGAGNDTLYGEGGNDTLVGGIGDDILDGGDGNDTLKGGRGNDTLKGGANSAVSFATTAASNAAAAIIASAKGGDTADYSDVSTGVIANIGNSNPGWPVSIAAGTATDASAGNTAVGTDTLSGIENLTGGAGNDVLVGNDGANILIGGAGSDTLIGGAGNDLLIGGDDTVADWLGGGAGDDVLILGNGGGTAKGGGGNDLIFGGNDGDWLYGEDDGEPEKDAGNDTIFGGGGNDYIQGNGGNDTLYGEDGNDTLIGGTGDDVMYGGAGNDTFIHKVGDGNDIVDGGGESGTSNPNYDVLTINGVASKTEFTLGKVTGGAEIVPAENKTDILVSYADGSVRADEIERVVFNLGEAGDTVSVGDLTGTAIAPTTVVINGGAGDDVIDLTGLAGTTVEITGNGGSDTVRLAGLWTDYVFTEKDGVYSASKNGAVIATSASVEKFAFTGNDTMPGYTVAAEHLVNVAPVAGDDAGAVVEAGGINNAEEGTATATGQLLDGDTDDNIQTSGTSVDTMTLVTIGDQSFGASKTITIIGTYGTLTVTAAGGYTYTLDNDLPATQALKQGQVVTEAFNYTIKDHAGLTDEGKLTISVTGANDAPVVTGGNSAAYVEPGILPGTGNANGAKLFANLGISVGDAEGADFSKVVISITNAEAGDTVHLFGTADRLLETGTVVLVTNQAGQTNAAGSTITLTNADNGKLLTAAEIKEALSLILFKTGDRVPTGSPDRVVSFVAYDEDGKASASHDVKIDITGQNDAPSWHAGTLSIIMSEDTSINLASDYASANPNERPTDTRLTPTDGDDEGDAQLTLSVAHGTITIDAVMAQSLGITIISGNGTRQVVVQGPMDPGLDDLLISSNNKLSGVTYKPDANFHGSDELRLTINDLGDGYENAGTATKVIAITVTPVNDAPVNTVPEGQTVAEDGVLTFSTLSVGDVDAGVLTVTLSVTRGVLALSGTTGLVSVENTGASVTISGTVAAINAALNGLTYSPIANESGSDTLTITTSDNGNSGDGGVKTDIDTVAITITPVADMPNLSVAPANGNEDAAISLSISSSLTDATETLTLSISDIPVGAKLTAGSGQSFTAEEGSTTADITGWNLSQLKITPPSNSDADFTVKVTAISTEINGDQKSVTSDLVVTVDPVNDGQATISLSNAAAPKVGDVLQISLGNDPDGGNHNVSYIWYRGNDVIVGATGASYQLTAADSGYRISAKASYTDGQGYGEVVTSDSTGVVIIPNTPPVSAADRIYTNASSQGFGTEISIAHAWLLKNDTDVENSALRIAQISHFPYSPVIVTNPGFGTGEMTVLIDLSPNDVNTSLSYVANDGVANGNSAYVSIYRQSSDLTGGNGDDILIDARDNGWGVTVTMDGGAGRDYIIGGVLDNLIIGDQNDYLIDGKGGWNGIRVNSNFTSTSDTQILNIDYFDMYNGTKLDVSNQAEGFDIYGSTGSDTITGGAGNDRIRGYAGADTFNIVSGSDVILDLGNGADILKVSANAAVSATAADDWTATASSTNEGTAVIAVDNHDVSVANAGGSQGWTLTNANKGSAVKLTGSANDDILIGGSGNDTLNGGAGNDNLNGGSGNDALNGGNGDDTLIGGSGNDVLTGGAGDDVLTGGANDDTFVVDAGKDTITDLSGSDVLKVSAGATADITATSNWSAGSNGSTVNNGTASIDANGNSISVSNAGGSNGWSLTNTSASAITMTGSSKADIITSSSAGDTIDAGAGADKVIINAGVSPRTWTVNLGDDNSQDKIVFNHASIGSGHNTVVSVNDFNVSHDKIEINVGATNATAGAFQTITSQGASVAANVAVIELVLGQNGTTGSLTDDGDGGAIETRIAQAIGSIAAGIYTVIVYSSTNTATAEAGIYSVTVSTASNLATGNMVVEHIMTFNDVGYGKLSASNFTSPVDPIILDLDHNGFAFSSLETGVSFDINADGHEDQVAWISADGILAYDLDGNGRIDNGSEIFTPSFNGGGHASGIAALATLDSNGDGKIDAEDDAFSKLSIWVDANHNGVSDDGELSGLLDHSITSISLDTTATSGASEDGQAVLSQGHFTLADGSTGDFLEVGFDTMFGGQPDHVVIGGEGSDVLVGGAGFTQFTGGAGADTFVLDPAALQTLDMADVVTDYKSGEGDVLDVSKLLDSMLGDAPVTAEAAAASIRTTVTGNDTTVSVQVDDGWKDVAVLQNHTEAVKILFDDKHTIDVSHH